MLILGSFCPVVSMPIVGNVNLCGNGQSGGMFVIGLASLGLVLLYFKRHTEALFISVIAGGVVLVDMGRLAERINDATAQIGSDMKDNMFAGLAQAMMQSFQLQWGWAVLLIGAGLGITGTIRPAMAEVSVVNAKRLSIFAKGSLGVIALGGVVTALLAHSSAGGSPAQSKANVAQASSAPASPERSPATHAAQAADSAEKIDWITADHEVAIGEVGIKVESVIIGLVHVNGGFDHRAGISKDANLMVKIRVTNRSSTKKLDYRTFAGSDFAFDRDYASMTDNFDNNYKRVNFGALKTPDGQVSGQESIYPGKDLTDVLVFEAPLETAKTLKLELPGKNVGGTGVVRIAIPSTMIQRE